MQCVFRMLAIPALLILMRSLAGIVTVQAQEKLPIDSLHIFNAKVDTVWLGFSNILRLSTLYDSADKEDWHYIYRWNTGERTEAIQVKFNGQRKVLYVGQRFSAIHWPEEYDTFLTDESIGIRIMDPQEDTCIVCVQERNADTVLYEWEILLPKNQYLGTERCQAIYKKLLPLHALNLILCTETVIYGDEQITQQSLIDLNHYSRGETIHTKSVTRWHDLNVWAMPTGTQIYARLCDTLHLFVEPNPEGNSGYERYEIQWWELEPWRFNYLYIPEINIHFADFLFRRCVRYNRATETDTFSTGNIFIYWGIKPNAEIETDSVWVFFPQYPYSNLGGRVDICLPFDAPLPSAEDTVYTFNLGPWNRELEYVEYAWLDGTKDVAGRDSVVGTDSAFAYLFGRMDSLSPELYAGMLVTRVASDSLWQDSCSCYIPCTDDACHRYDTVKIYLHLLPSLKENVFLPQDTTLCAHLDLDLQIPDTITEYRFFWLDKDSVALPYGYDTTRYTVVGMRGLDGYGAGTDTREPRFFQLRLDHKLCGVSFFDTLLVYDQVRPAFELTCHDTLICLDVPVEIDTLSPHVYGPFYVFEWNDGTKGSGYTFIDSGVYVLRFFVDKDFSVCGYDTAFDTIYVRWSDPAQTRITLSDTSFCEKLSVILDASVPFDSTRYSWQEGPLPDMEEDFEMDSIIFTDPVLKVDREKTLSLFLVDTMGCVNAKEIAVTIDDCSPKLDIPNVFTPNGDGVNDVWRFKQLEKCTDVKVEVVDRWGQPVLKTKVATANDFEWNGTIHNKGRRLPDGPYFYMVTYKDVYGKSKVQSGSITILGTSE